jgi:hypothetical protein
MTVHTAGPVTLTATDFKTVHKGTEIGIKCFAWDPTMPSIFMVERAGDGTYKPTYSIFEFSDTPNTTKELIAAAGGTVKWIKDVLLPRINDALRQRFPPGSGGPEVGSIDDIDANLGAVLRWAPQADGTIQVTA